ncbi:MAG: 5-bromo-4-chloroindolyl phosphate hydrolysis family protein [Bradyrhizobium sp.]
MPTVSSETGWIVGGVVAAIAVPALAIGVGMPFWLACVVGIATGGGAIAVLAPRSAFPLLEASGAARGKVQLVRELLIEAAPHAERLDEAAGRMRERKVAECVRHLAVVARRILAAIEKDPLRLDRVRRFLTYYLPRAAEIAQAYAELEQAPVTDPQRLTSTRELIDRLDTAFTRYATSLQDADLDKLDIELKLLKSALDEDLGPATPPAPSSERRDKV